MKKEPLPLPKEIDPAIFDRFIKLRVKYLTETKINEVIERLYEVKSYSNYLEDLLDESNIKYLEIEDWITWRNQNAGEEIK